MSYLHVQQHVRNNTLRKLKRNKDNDLIQNIGIYFGKKDMFVNRSNKKTAVKRRTIDTSTEDSKLKRNNSHNFLLKDKNGSLILVCRTFF